MITLKDIISKPDYKTKVINVEAWGGDIKIRSLSSKHVSDILIDNEEDTLIAKSVKAIIAGCLDEKDKPLFKNEHFEMLADKAQEPIMFISNEILALTGLAGDKKN